MKTLVIKALDTAIGNFPLSNKHSIELIKKGDGTGTLTLLIRTTDLSIITIKGGVFINDLNEESTQFTTLASNSVFTSIRVKVNDENAYIYVPTSTRWAFNQVWPVVSEPNSPIINYGGADLYNLESVQDMFYNASGFNDDISNWDTSLVTNANNTFNGASSFNRDINKWNVGNVVSMVSLFRNAAYFNQELSSWGVSKVTSMDSMFRGATAFNKDISAWNFNVNVNLTNFMVGKSNYNPIFYDRLLQNLANKDWTARAVAKVLNMGTNKYTAAGAAHRATLVSGGWTITDGGLV